ncbi:hypothetical protein ACJMK2_013336 [Sinanodonta woodiana]|uniref:Malignant fibrous histiocytoma-amplified sequence 1 homolog n=1 Tax=Sinanodonta woodiana TaxID=1069815 RepID=A0ABD3UX66_SINWO
MSQLQTLKMKGNFLKHVSKNIIDCKQLKYLDLTGAMKLNSWIPAEIFLLSNLQILDLTNNYFTEISSEVMGLTNLKKFIMRRNALLRLPKELFTLKYLEYLDLSESYLEEIPSCVSDLKMLKGLYLCHNKIKHISEEICNCENLLELQLHNNELESLPDKLFKLRKLEELTLDNNKLKRLPLMLDKLVRLQETGRISLRNNPLTVPPLAICEQGIDSLYGYLKELRICEAKHRRKMILIGASQAGKSSLRNALILGRSKLTAEHERTWVMERHLWEPEPDLRIQILDFGGHHIYSAAHHMFLTPEALHLVVFDVSRYCPNLYDDLVGNWVEAITDRAPGASIMLVCTHSDLVSREEIEEKIQDILDKMHTEEESKLGGLKTELQRLESELQRASVRESGETFNDVAVERMRDKANYLRRILTTRVTLPDMVYVVSCAEELTGVHDLQSSLFSMLHNSEERPLPQSWYKFLTVLQEQKARILSWHQTLAIFERTMKNMNQSMYMLQGSPEKSMAMVLKYLHVTGEILWYQDNPELSQIVFHRPETLVEMLRTIFRHDYDEVIKYQDNYGHLAGLTRHKFDKQKQEFLHHGLMTQEMLHYTLLFCDLSIDARELFIDLMLKFDLCYEVAPSVSASALLGASRILQFPWFLTADPPVDISQKWPNDIPPENIIICFQLQFPRKEPPNFFEKVSARLQSYISSREDWKDGILASKNRSQLLLKRENSNGIASVTLSVRGSELQELWFLVRKCRNEMLILLKEWPFVRFDAHIICSHCLLSKKDDPTMWPGEVVDMTCQRNLYWIKCPNSPDQLIPACFVYPLDEEFQDDLGEHIKAVQEFLQGVYDTVDGTGNLLSDLGLAYVASRLGADWNLVALNLHLTQPEIERIQMDNPTQTLNQIRKALTTWFSRSYSMDDHEKVQQLMNALEASSRNDLVFELKERFRIED